MNVTSLPPLGARPTVGLVMEVSGDKTAWAIIRSTAEAGAVAEHHVLNVNLNTEERRKLMMTAVEAASAFAVETQSMVDLVVYHSTARNELLDLGGEFGKVFILPRSAIAFDSVAYLHAMNEAHYDIGKESSHAPASILAATDGAYHRRYGGGAYGWVTDTGRHAYGKATANSSLEAELYAVLNLMTLTHTGSTLHILLDSKDAIEAVETGAVTRTRKTLPSTTLVLLHHIKTHRARMTLELEWVKGHNGHPLNDVADRLARLARQSLIFGTPTDASNKIAEDIVTGALQVVQHAA